MFPRWLKAYPIVDRSTAIGGGPAVRRFDVVFPCFPGEFFLL